MLSKLNMISHPLAAELIPGAPWLSDRKLGPQRQRPTPACSNTQRARPSRRQSWRRRCEEGYGVGVDLSACRQSRLVQVQCGLFLNRSTATVHATTGHPQTLTTSPQRPSAGGTGRCADVAQIARRLSGARLWPASAVDGSGRQAAAAPSGSESAGRTRRLAVWGWAREKAHLQRARGGRLASERHSGLLGSRPAGRDRLAGQPQERRILQLGEQPVEAEHASERGAWLEGSGDSRLGRDY
ncbi:hypothetical protein BDV95DRAFT_588884 [Massariosphaeria phaeospora]|uniref:Uncharacterized protein n=1 Tax=Massariosphaeria phaeospora TaxID=100035 RepID=A0A7C8IQU2_9PLEO|nr:hypothetical protein BDV95DRAFT_588884 [Massariosphaeria phaeospora]